MGTRRHIIIAGLSMGAALTVAACQAPEPPPVAAPSSTESTESTLTTQEAASTRSSTSASLTTSSARTATSSRVSTTTAASQSSTRSTATPPPTTAPSTTTTTPVEDRCPWQTIEDSQPGELGQLYCDGEWAHLGWANTDGMFFLRYVDGRWTDVPAAGESWPSGYPCYDVEYWAGQGAPETITNRMLVCTTEEGEVQTQYEPHTPTSESTAESETATATEVVE